MDIPIIPCVAHSNCNIIKKNRTKNTVYDNYKMWIEGFPTSIALGFFKFGMSYASSSMQDC